MNADGSQNTCPISAGSDTKSRCMLDAIGPSVVFRSITLTLVYLSMFGCSSFLSSSPHSSFLFGHILCILVEHFASIPCLTSLSVRLILSQWLYRYLKALRSSCLFLGNKLPFSSQYSSTFLKLQLSSFLTRIYAIISNITAFLFLGFYVYNSCVAIEPSLPFPLVLYFIVYVHYTTPSCPSRLPSPP
ncbi:hypothetical protein QCA50_006120 [Cerrena zonata]|uniref:Uncharacterized protein n=1 Tax=Cerrena zonata TaxID=2478898 RepID=A0AAW0GM70_9APHY